MPSSSETMWLLENDMLEPSLMNTGICPGSVFDKFGWDAEFLGPDTDELLDEISIKTEPEDPLCENSDFSSLGPIFPDLIDDSTKSSASDVDYFKPLMCSPNSASSSSSSTSTNVPENNYTFVFKQEPKAVAPGSVKKNSINISNNDQHVIIDNSTATTSVNKLKNNLAVVISSPLATTTATSTTTTAIKTGINSIIRIPVKRTTGATLGGATGGRIKAVVVCPDRSKSIVCNVVRSSNRGIVIQKPVNRSWLNVCGSIRNESTKLPIKVNVISSKENGIQGLNLKNVITKTELPASVKQEPLLDSSSVLLPISSDIDSLCTESLLMSATNIKTEPEESRPETPQSMDGSDDEFHPFSSPSKELSTSLEYFGDSLQDDLVKSYLMVDDDNLSSDSYKCFPPAEVTGQIQPIIPDIFKYTPNSSPTSNGESLIDSFYTKLDSSYSSNRTQFYNKAAANVDHDYGFTCRTTKSSNTIGSIFNVDSLGIQTPSASEPPTDSDDDDTLLSDVSLLNRDFDCSELDREQSEYFENLKHQLKLAELVCKASEKEHRLSKAGNTKDRKLLGRNRKRKLSRETSIGSKNVSGSVNSSIDGMIASGASVSSTGGGTLKIRLPVRDRDITAKKKKTGNGGRIFSPTERHLHNTNEQVRRIEMRQSFEELRRLIPQLLDKPRAPKVSILQEAKSYCDELFHTDLKMQAQVTALKCQQERLRCSLSRLRRHVAASRY